MNVRLSFYLIMTVYCIHYSGTFNTLPVVIVVGSVDSVSLSGIILYSIVDFVLVWATTEALPLLVFFGMLGLALKNEKLLCVADKWGT